jgi:transposase InsO family protein
MSAVDQAQLVLDRAKLRQLRRDQPQWSIGQLSKATHHSKFWVKKWLPRFELAPPDDEQVLWGWPTTPKTPRPKPPSELLDRLEYLREHPPDGLNRTPGPKPLLYYLQKDPVLREKGLTPPRSTSTIWRYLVLRGCIARPGLKKHQSLERAEPGTAMATDFKDSSCLTIDPDGKKQHLLETMLFVDEGSSYWWEAIVRGDFNAETVIETLFEVFEHTGLPQSLRFDRDPRFVGSASGRDFPSAMVRMLHVLGVQPLISPPHRPDKNPFAERLNRSYGSECLKVYQPDNEGRVREVTEEYRIHYNTQRPHQGLSCHNQPPKVAFPDLPRLPALPQTVDSDKWLLAIDKEHFSRKVEANGGISLDKRHYYLGREHAGQRVVLVVDAQSKELVVYHHHTLIKRLPIKGLYRQTLSLEEWRTALLAEARSERRGWRAGPS